MIPWLLGEAPGQISENLTQKNSSIAVITQIGNIIPFGSLTISTNFVRFLDDTLVSWEAPGQISENLTQKKSSIAMMTQIGNIIPFYHLPTICRNLHCVQVGRQGHGIPDPVEVCRRTWNFKIRILVRSENIRTATKFRKYSTIWFARG
jgi:hypothetical protein